MRRVVAALFPSIPAAMRTIAEAEAFCAQTPVPGPQGEGGPGTGQTPEGEGRTSGSFVGREVAAETPRPPVPPREDVDFRPHPALRWELEDTNLAALIRYWKATSA